MAGVTGGHDESICNRCRITDLFTNLLKRSAVYTRRNYGQGVLVLTKSIDLMQNVDLEVRLRKTSFLLLLLSTICLSLNAESVSLSITGNAAITDQSTLSFTADGTGSLAPLGNTSLSINGTFDSTLTTGSGSFLFDSGSGNTLTGTFTAPSIIFDPNGTAASGSGTADVLGGTGLFAGYTGDISLDGSAIATGDFTSAFSLMGAGDVFAPVVSPSSAPEPATYTFILLAISAAAIWRYQVRVRTITRR